MTDEIPDYLKGFQGKTGLYGLDEKDMPGFKSPEWQEPVDAAVENVLHAARVGHKWDGEQPVPEWLLTGEPRAVQIEALRRSYYGYALYDGKDMEPTPRIIRPGLTTAKGWGHFMQMRLGKTPTFLNEFMLARRDHGFKNVIMLSPNAYKRDWISEAERFGVPVEGHAFVSTERDKAINFLHKNQQNGFFLSVNYEALGSDETLRMLEDVAGRDTIIGADESIHIKSFNSGFTEGALAIAKLCGMRRPLTGKPVTQGPHDLWAQLRFAGYLDGYPYHAFKTAHCKMGGFKNKKVVGVQRDRVASLQETIANSSFLARRSNWMVTPGIEYGTLNVDMIPEQKHHYDRMETDFITELENGVIISADQAVTKYIKLQQISSGFVIDEQGIAHDIMPIRVNPKINRVRELIAEELDSKSKILIFVHHNRSRELLLEALEQYNPCVIAGQSWHNSTKRDIVSEKARFNGDPNSRVMVAQIQAVRYGHTLMGTPEFPCTYELWFENNYSLNDRSQGEERPQGAGQTHTISCLDMICSPHERRIIQAVQFKEDVSALILNYARESGVLPHGRPTGGRDEDGLYT